MQIDPTVIAEIRHLHRQREFSMVQRKRAHLSLGAFIRTNLGWTKDGDEKANSEIRKMDADMIADKADRGEFAPIIVAVIVAGRSGAAFTAQLGSMRLTEEIDAIRTLGLSPRQVLVLPRVLAGLLMLPLLVVVGDVIGVFGGFLIAVYRLDFNAASYLQATWEYLEPIDVISGLVKAATFGFLVSLMGCFHGFNSRGGAQGVGAATTSAVVSASILILIFNYIITQLFFAR